MTDTSYLKPVIIPPRKKIGGLKEFLRNKAIHLKKQITKRREANKRKNANRRNSK